MFSEPCRQLIEMDSTRYATRSFVNYFAHIPEVFLQMGDISGAKQFMSEYRDCLELIGSTIHWVWSAALIDILEGRVNNSIVSR